METASVFLIHWVKLRVKVAGVQEQQGLHCSSITTILGSSGLLCDWDQPVGGRRRRNLSPPCGISSFSYASTYHRLSLLVIRCMPGDQASPFYPPPSAQQNGNKGLGDIFKFYLWFNLKKSGLQLVQAWSPFKDTIPKWQEQPESTPVNHCTAKGRTQTHAWLEQSLSTWWGWGAVDRWGQSQVGMVEAHPSGSREIWSSISHTLISSRERLGEEI